MVSGWWTCMIWEMCVQSVSVVQTENTLDNDWGRIYERLTLHFFTHFENLTTSLQTLHTDTSRQVGERERERKTGVRWNEWGVSIHNLFLIYVFLLDNTVQDEWLCRGLILCFLIQRETVVLLIFEKVKFTFVCRLQQTIYGTQNFSTQNKTTHISSLSLLTISTL